MRLGKSLRVPNLVRNSALVAGWILLGVIVSACGGGAATPTPTSLPTLALSPVSSPARPSLASPIPAASLGPVSTPIPTAAAASGPSQSYTVQAGDTLLSIAQKVYGDNTLWQTIYDANKTTIGANPDALQVGEKLTVPPKP